MSRFTPQQRAAWSDHESCWRLAIAMEHAEAHDSDENPIPWWPVGWPSWIRMLWHHTTLEPLPPWISAYAGMARLDVVYAEKGQTRNTWLTWREALDAVWYFVDIDEN